MNSAMAKALLAKIYEKQAQNPYGGEVNTGPRGFHNAGYPTTKYTAPYTEPTNPLAPPNPWAPTTIPGSPGAEIEERSYLSRLGSGISRNLGSASDAVSNYLAKKQAPAQDAINSVGNFLYGASDQLLRGGAGLNTPQAQAAAAQTEEKPHAKSVNSIFKGLQDIGSAISNAPGQIFRGGAGLNTPQAQAAATQTEEKPHAKSVNSIFKGLQDTGSAISQGLQDYQNEQGVVQRLANMVSPMSWYDTISKNYQKMTNPAAGSEQQASALKKQRQDEELAAGQTGRLNQALLLSLGLGAGAGGLYSLYRAMKPKPKRRQSDDMATAAYYPVEKAADGYFDFVFGGAKQPSVWDNPLLVPGMVAGGLGAAYTGFKGTKYLADKLADRARQHELDSAKRDFEEALMSNYDKPSQFDPIKKNKLQKKSNDESTMTKLAGVLDELYDATFQKKASGLSFTTGGLTSDLLRSALPVGLTLGGLGALATGAMAYDATRSSGKGEALKDALRERARQHYEESMPPLYITPEAINVSKKKKPSTEENQRSSVV